MGDVLLDNLNLEISPVSQPPLMAELGRPLLAEDLVILETTRLGSKPQSLKKIRAIHHQAARLLATGMKAVEVGALTGFSSSRLSILKNDPTFAELLAFYTEQVNVRFQDMQDKLATLGYDAAQELHERVIDNPEDITNGTLIQLMSAALDRSGHGPTSKHQVNHNHTFSSEETAEMKAKVLEAQKGGSYDKTLPAGSGADLGGAEQDRPLLPQLEEVERIESGGAAV